MTLVSEVGLKRLQRAIALLSVDRTWLESQPHMMPWEQGAAGLVEKMDAWIGRYIREIIGDHFTPDEDQYDRFFRRLWQCWLFQWQERSTQAPDKRLDGFAVADLLDADDRSLVRDVVLAEGIVQGHEAALACFLREDHGRISTAAVRANPRFGDDAWAEMLSKIFPLRGEISVSGVEADGSPAEAPRQCVEQESMLKDYAGQGGLSQYVRRGVINLANTQGRRKCNRGARFDEKEWEQRAGDAGEPADEVAEREIRQQASASRAECEQLYDVVVRDALDRLSPELRVALYYTVLDRKPIEQVAAILSICRENVWRRLRNAKELLELYLAASPVLDVSRRKQFAQCRQWLFVGGDTSSLAAKLAEMLREYPPRLQGRGDEP